MTKILGIDYGTVRTGLALTDSARIIASPLQAVQTNEIFVFLEKLFQKESIEVVVIGEAKYLNGEASQTTVLQTKFVTQFAKKFPDKQVVRIDEAFTSIEAERSLHLMGMKKTDRQKKGNVDKVSAALILQSYLDQRG